MASVSKKGKHVSQACQGPADLYIFDTESERAADLPPTLCLLPTYSYSHDHYAGGTARL